MNFKHCDSHWKKISFFFRNDYLKKMKGRPTKMIQWKKRCRRDAFLTLMISIYKKVPDSPAFQISSDTDNIISLFRWFFLVFLVTLTVKLTTLLGYNILHSYRPKFHGHIFRTVLCKIYDKMLSHSIFHILCFWTSKRPI